MKKKLFVRGVKVLAVIIAGIILYSCSNENPVTTNNNPKFDTSRFNWQSIEMKDSDFGQGIWSLWSPDTSEVFMCTWNNFLIHYKNGQFSEIQYGPNIYMSSIDGLSPTEGYIIGIERLTDKDIPHIEKWNGSTFTNVPVNYSFENTFVVSRTFVKSSTEMWISSSKGLVYKFDGVNLTKFSLPDTIMYAGNFIYDENNRLRYLTSFFNTGIDTLERNYVYEFNGQNWTKVYQDITPVFTRHYDVLNTGIYAIDYPRSISKLENNILTPVFSTTDFYILNVSGSSFSNIMSFGGTQNKMSFLNWNGNQWSDENTVFEYFQNVDFNKMINENYFCAVVRTSTREYLYRGFRKKK
jgi:hypothetical protein